MSQQLRIRQRFLAGETVSGIADDLQVDRKTVRKYALREDFTVKPPKVRNPGFPSLDEYKEFIDGLLQEDVRSWRKQKLTAKRVWVLACERGCTSSQSTVERYVRQWRMAHGGGREAMLELTWMPGEAQVDFGEADVLDGAQVVRRYFLVVSFPYSNMAYLQLFGGQSAECVCQGLIDVFAHIGGTPSRLVFDNAAGVGHRRKDTVTMTDLFSRLRAHYGFEVSFCNPASGNEKGNVENKVGFLRRNLLTPMIHASDLEKKNSGLLEECETLQFDRVHYRKDRRIQDLFDEDRAALRVLPSIRFEAVTYQVIRTDRYGAITVGKHHYSADPQRYSTDVVAKIGAHRLDVLTGDTHEVLACHQRLWSSQPASSIDVISQLRILTVKGRGWRNTAIRTQLPDNLVAVLDGLDHTPRRHALAQLADSMQASGVQATLDALSEIVGRDRPVDFTAVAAFAARINGYGLDPDPLPGPDLGVYDQLREVGV